MTDTKLHWKTEYKNLYIPRIQQVIEYDEWLVNIVVNATAREIAVALHKKDTYLRRLELIIFLIRCEQRFMAS